MDIETIELASGNRLRIVQDESPESPREWDNLSIMAFFHNRYNLGDKDTGLDIRDYESWEDMEKDIIKRFDPVVIRKVRMYDHSGISISMDDNYPYNDQWDSGIIGFVFIPRSKALENWSIKRISPKRKNQCMEIMRGEIETYDQYLRGDVYGFVLEDSKGNHLDSCSGFFGSNPHKNGMAENLSEKIP